MLTLLIAPRITAVLFLGEVSCRAKHCLHSRASSVGATEEVSRALEHLQHLEKREGGEKRETLERDERSQ